MAGTVQGQAQYAGAGHRDDKARDKVFIGSGAAEPQVLVKALIESAGRLADTRIMHIMTLGVAPYTEEKFTDQFRHNAFFIGANTRQAVAEGRADYTPVFLSEIPRLFRSGQMPIDVALIKSPSRRPPNSLRGGSGAAGVDSSRRMTRRTVDVSPYDGDEYAAVARTAPPKPRMG